MRTVVVGPPDLDCTDNREKRFGAQFLEARRVTARTGNCQVIGVRLLVFQQLRQGSGAGMMQGGTDRCLGTLQIKPAGRLAVPENDAKQLLYFVGDFFVDRFSRFFSSADGSVSVTGRRSQIRSLTSSSCSPNSRKRRHSATSRCALAKSAAEENVSVTVFPFTLRVNR